MQRLLNGVGTMGQTGRFRPEQIAQRSTWSGVNDSPAGLATLSALTLVETQRHHLSTVTRVNPLDPVYEEARWLNGAQDVKPCHCPHAAGRY